MPISFKFYHDSGLTQEITGANPLTATQDISGGLPAVDKVIYFGSTVSTNKAQATSNPGVDAIVVSLTDANTLSGSPTSEFKLALSAGGLAGAVAGASLSLSATVNGGVANAVPIHTRRSTALTTVGAYTDISLQTNSLTETAI